jgi:hypothetical protein
VTPPSPSSSPAAPPGKWRPPVAIITMIRMGVGNGAAAVFINLAHGNVVMIVAAVVCWLVAFFPEGLVGDLSRNRNRPEVSSGVTGCAEGCGMSSPADGLMARAGWRIMRAAAWLMPRAAGRRWLAEAASSLFEASPGQRRRVVRSYLLTAPRVIAESWAGHLTRRIRSH